MKLKRLDIKGFKSFADKLNLEFDNGITCIVGPNGSGKSNIADAIRWVLGEQSAKSLRGSKMEEVIFSGTDMRKPTGMAEVAMLIDNSQGKLNTEFNEVEIKRRVYRSGEGEYYINNTSCRLKDIYDLFYDTGIGKEGYSIIGQGKIDEILNNKPAERRSFFEEATGISKYRIRLKDTERKLDEEQQNIIRINDIIEELSNQIGPLEEQSKKAIKFLEIKQKLEQDEINIYVYDYKKANEQLNSINEKKSNLEAEIYKINDNITEIKAEKDSIVIEYDGLKAKIDREKGKLVDIDIENERRDSEIKVVNEKVINAKDRTKESIERKKIISTMISEKNVKHKEMLHGYESISQNIESKNVLHSTKQKHYDEMVNTIEGKEELLENTRNEIARKINLSYEVKNQKEKLILMKDNLKTRLDDVETNIKYSDRMYTEIDQEMNLNKNQIAEYFIQKDNAKEVIKKLEKEITNVNDKLNEIHDQQLSANREINNMKSRHNVYLDMQQHHEGFSKSIKAILNLKKGNDKKWDSIRGVLGELVNVIPNYEIAIDVALGARIQNVVVENEETAKEVIQYLKTNKEGRATFVPMNSVKSNAKFSIDKNVLTEKGVLGLAIDFVKFDTEYRDIIDSMLGKTIVIDHVDNAISFSKKHKYSYKVVTIDGEIFNIGGSITGGSGAKDGTNIFTRTREIEKLKVDIERLEVELTRLHDKNKEAISVKGQFEKDILIKNKEREILEIEIAKLQNNYEIIERSKQERLEVVNQSVDEKANIENQILEVSKEITYKEEQERQIEISILESRALIETNQTSIEAEKVVKDRLLTELTDLKIELASLIQKKLAYENEKSRFDEEISNYSQEVKAIDEKISGYEKLIEMSETTKEKLNIEITKEKEVGKELKKSIEEDEMKFKELEDKVSKIDLKIQELSVQAAVTQDKIYKIDSNSIEYKMKMEAIEEGLFEKYNMTYEESLEREEAGFNYSKAKDNIKLYKTEIDKLGNVNLDSIEQFKTISERYNFLVSQRDDVVAAEQKLKSIIGELLQAMEKQFKYEFTQIDKNFNVIFKELFGGGEAKLKLVDEENILDSGIEIVVQPPGKKLQNLMLLSGGEKALTAIALLFAILKMRPSPFCLLDEIEAALDDANVDRYANYIKKYSGNTQFLVITHRKGTMEISDYLYGVTMQEKGISKVISVKLEDVSVD